MTLMTMFTQSQNSLTSYEFSQHRSYTDFGIKLDGFIRILAWSFLTNYKVKQVLIWNKHGY